MKTRTRLSPHWVTGACRALCAAALLSAAGPVRAAEAEDDPVTPGPAAEGAATPSVDEAAGSTETSAVTGDASVGDREASSPDKAGEPGRATLAAGPSNLASSLAQPLRGLAPELGTALDAMAAGKWARARDLLETWLAAHPTGPEAGAARVLRARCDARLGNLGAADAGLREAVAALPELSEWVRAERARLALRDARFEDADALVDAMSADNREFYGLLVERAQRELRSGRLIEALKSLGRLTPGLSFDAERAVVSRLLADARLAMTGDRAAWLGQLAELRQRWPKTGAGRDAEALLVAAAADPSVPGTPLGVDDLVEAALRRATGGGAKAALPVLKALELRFPRRTAGLSTLIEQQALVKKRPAAVRQAIAAALPTVRETIVRDGLWELEARALRQLERYDDALEVYRTLGRDGGTSLRRATALLEGGRMARRMGRVTHARWFFDRFLARHREFPEARAEALWNLGWFGWREGLLDEADNFFRLIAVETPESTDSSGRTYAERATYWRARILHRRDRIDEARSLFAEVERRWPLSYYANLAAAWRRRTGDATDVLPRPGKDEARTPPTVASITTVEAEAVPALTLVRVGLEDDARQWLRQLHRRERLGIAGVQLLSALYRAEGNESLAHWVVQGGDALTAPPVKDARGRWLSAFPRPFGDIVEKEAKEHGIDPLIVWAIMRQESGFRSEARSSAKAHGLMQVLLPTARHVARALLGERAPSLAKVYTPGANVHYGAAYLRHLLDRYQGNPALAFAGYNAGPGAVDKWLKRFGPIACDEFVEEIPYAEAQGYARKVIRSYAAYTYLYGRTDDPFLDLPLKLPARGRAVALRD